MDLTIHHHGTPYPIHLAPDATLQDLSAQLAQSFHIPIENQKLLIAPKPGLQKAPFAATRLHGLLPVDSPKFKVTLLGTPTKDIDDLNAEGASTKQKLEARNAAHAEAARKNAAAATAARKTGGGRGSGGVHTLNDSTTSYTFHRLAPLPYLPNPERSLSFLTRLRDDPGIRAAMANHQFSVPLLTEMNPAEHTTSEGRTLGLNRNRGEVIELRLRTDAYDGYRDYRTIRKTLCHELAHCVFGEHDRAFWDLTGRIEKEVERGDWTRGGRSVGGEEFFNPGDWEVEKDGAVVDERGWSGGSFVLGGLGERQGQSSGGGGGGDSRREIMARAAEERLKKTRGQGEQ